MLISITNCILTSVFQSPYYDHSLMVSTIVITGLISVINFFGLLLPNLICCSSLREEAEPMQQPILSSQAQLPSYIPPSSDFANVPFSLLIIQHILLDILQVAMIVVKEIFMLILSLSLFHCNQYKDY